MEDVTIHKDGSLEVKEVPPHQERVYTELAELEDKLRKLNAFFYTALFNGLPQDERADLEQQASVMSLYCAILRRRIQRF